MHMFAVSKKVHFPRLTRLKMLLLLACLTHFTDPCSNSNIICTYEMWFMIICFGRTGSFFFVFGFRNRLVKFVGAAHLFSVLINLRTNM